MNTIISKKGKKIGGGRGWGVLCYCYSKEEVRESEKDGEEDGISRTNDSEGRASVCAGGG